MHDRRRSLEDESASGQVIAFMTAGAIFLAAVATVLVVSQGTARDPDARDSFKEVQASGLADILIGSAGIGWDAGPDGISRLGLMAENGSGLDADSLDALRGAVEEPTDNDKVDYDEALTSLGMDPDGTAGFHLRMYPVGLDTLSIDPSLSIAYIGDWQSVATATVTSTSILPLGSTESTTIKANAALNTTMISATAKERQAIRSLGVDFTDRVFLTTDAPLLLVDVVLGPDVSLFTYLPSITLLEGDIYPDDRNYLKEALPDRLGLYDVVIVGSGVDHSKLNTQEIKDGISNWTLDGGTLIVLGSDDQSTAWLNPLLNVGVDTVNGAPTAPDIAHPLLKEPNELAWTSYNTHDLGWDIQESGAVAAYEDFSHVVIQEGEDVLAVSKESSFGDGRIILTTYQARDISTSISAAEAVAFLENMVAYADRSALYLDYGGDVPVDQPVALAVRQSWLWDEVYGQMPIRIEVLAWG